MTRYDPGVSWLTEAFGGCFDDAAPALRTVGREAEHPVVTPSGDAADVRPILEALAREGDYRVKREGEMVVGLVGPRSEYALEVGWGTVEVITGPCEDLVALERAHEAAMAPLVRLAEEQGARVLGYGVQPKTPGSLALMSPKERYGVLLESLGDLWLWFTTTASDQTHVDIARDELVPLVNLATLMTPAIVALCANSPVHSGAPSGACSSRELEMGRICAEDARHGMLDRPVADLLDYTDRMARQRFLMRRDAGGRNHPMRGPFLEWMNAQDAPDFDAFLLHEHYIWNSARPRSAHSTIELRSACQQPWGEHMAAAALSLGVISAAPALARHIDQRLGGDAWPAMRAWHHQAIARGLDAPEPTPGLLAELLEICEAGLAARGRGEARYMAPLWRRLARRKAPAQDALATFAAGGVEALVAERAIRI